MKEAQVTCLIAEYVVGDLDMILHIGDRVYLSEEEARGSQDLKMGRQAGAVRVEYLQRCTMAKPPKPPSRPLPPHTRLTRQGYKAGRVEVVEPSVKKVERVDLQAKEAVPKPDPKVAELQQEIAELRKVIRDLPGQMAEALASNMVGGHAVQPVTRSPVPVEDHDEPVFIPSNIVQKDSKPQIAVKSGSSASDDLDAAAAALKAAKPKKTRKRRTRKKKSEDSDDG